MPHTNNPSARLAARKASRPDPRKPKFLQKKSSSSTASGTSLPAPSLDPNSSDHTTAPPLPPTTPSSLPRAAQAALITSYHALEKQLASTTDPSLRAELLARQEELGGLPAYQAASVHGGEKVRGGESGKWCVRMLKELKVGVERRKEGGEGDGEGGYRKVEREKLRLLDVGAIAGTSYSDWPWISTTSIDLNPQAPHVVRSDFFDFPPPAPSGLYDVVCLSLVLNFVGSLTQRSLMLLRAHQFLKPQGLLYVVLPLPCLTNSRYMNHERWIGILKTLGWEEVRKHDSGKLTFWLLKRVLGEDGKVERDGKRWGREEVRGGARRNNFCVIVNNEGVEGGEGGEEEEEGGEKEKKGKKGKKEKEEDDDDEWGGVKNDEASTKMVTEDAPVDDEEEEWGGITDEPEWGGIVDVEIAPVAVTEEEEEEEWKGC